MRVDAQKGEAVTEKPDAFIAADRAVNDAAGEALALRDHIENSVTEIKASTKAGRSLRAVQRLVMAQSARARLAAMSSLTSLVAACTAAKTALDAAVNDILSP